MSPAKFRFIDNSNIRKEYLWKDGLHLKRRILKDEEIVT